MTTREEAFTKALTIVDGWTSRRNLTPLQRVEEALHIADWLLLPDEDKSDARGHPAVRPTTRVPALTLWRPWSTLVVHHGKRIENRPWSTDYRGPLYIHAGHTFDAEAVAFVRMLGVEVSPAPEDHPTGLVAIADLVGICDAELRRPYIMCECGSWAACGQFHWQLDNVRPLAEAVPCRGRQGLWFPATTSPRELSHER